MRGKKEKTVYEMLYAQQRSRPVYFSINTVLTYSEIPILILFSSCQETATQLCIVLADPNNTELTFPFYYWILGSATGLFLIAVFNPFLFHKSMVFIPLSVFFSLQVLMYLGILIANLFTYLKTWRNDVFKIVRNLTSEDD